MLNCDKCGYRVKLNRAIKSRVRVDPYPCDCGRCGNRFYVTLEDVQTADQERLTKEFNRNFTGKRGRYKQ